MRAKKYFVLLLIVSTLVYLDAKKLSKGRSSGRSSSRKTSYNPQPVPTSQTAPKPSLFGWQEKPVQRSQATGARQSKPPSQPKPSGQSHSYPSSATGLSGQGAKQPSQDNVQRSHSYPQNSGNHQTNVNQQNHAYPASNGMSGQSKPGASYPNQQGGLSGNSPSGNSPKQPPSYQETMQKSNSYPQNNAQPNHGYPASHGLSGNSGSGVGYPSHQGAPAGQYPSGVHGYNPGNNYRAPPPPYSNNYGHGYGGYGGGGGYNPSYGSQMPGYFGNYGNSGRGFGGMSRGSALTGVGIAGAGVGTLLTGLALWNLARSTGNRHHTVIYDNRGQPVAVAPADNSTTVDPILGDLVNCSLTISNSNATEVLAIPCSIATSFTPEADVKDSTSINGDKDGTVCTVSVVNKASREFSTTIPCSILLNTAAENNVTEPPPNVNGTLDNGPSIYMQNDTMINNSSQVIPPALALDSINGTLSTTDTNNCTVIEPGTTRDPLNPCFALNYDVSVQPILSDDNKSTPQQ